MTKQVDHDQRRRHIAAAVWQITRTDGLAAVSMRRVARVAGLSTPLLQWYFREKDAMLRHAMGELASLMQEQARLRRDMQYPADDARQFVHSQLRAALTELFPLDDARRTMLLVHLDHVARATSDPVLDAAFHAMVNEVFDLAVDRDEPPRTINKRLDVSDPDVTVAVLVTTAVGLATEMLAGDRSTESATRVLDRCLELLLAPHSTITRGMVSAPASRSTYMRNHSGNTAR